MSANQLLAQLRALTKYEPEVVPNGWKDAHGWAKEFGIKRRASDAALARGVLAGIVEKKIFRVNRCGQIRDVAHYRPAGGK